MRKNRFTLILAALLAGVFVLSACSGLAPADQGVQESGSPAQSAVEPSAETETGQDEAQAPDPTDAQAQEPDQASDPESDSPTEAPAATAGAVVPRQGLEASDPSSAVLASGQVQLVEFFAFW
jgi:hypothetical protein